MGKQKRCQVNCIRCKTYAKIGKRSGFLWLANDFSSNVVSIKKRFKLISWTTKNIVTAISMLCRWSMISSTLHVVLAFSFQWVLVISCYLRSKFANLNPPSLSSPSTLLLMWILYSISVSRVSFSHCLCVICDAQRNCTRWTDERERKKNRMIFGNARDLESFFCTRGDLCCLKCCTSWACVFCQFLALPLWPKTIQICLVVTFFMSHTYTQLKFPPKKMNIDMHFAGLMLLTNQDFHIS